MGKLDNKIALITGSSSGIGKAVALAFAKVVPGVVDAVADEACAQVEYAYDALKQGMKSGISRARHCVGHVYKECTQD